MTDTTRKYIMNRRAGGGTDLTKVTSTGGGMKYPEAVKSGVWTINSTCQIGIATASEAGLSANRYPIRVIIGEPPKTFGDLKCTTAVSYWRLLMLDGKEVLFSRRPLNDVTALNNFYKVIPDVDDKMWELIQTPRAAPFANKLHEEVSKLSEAVYPHLLVEAHTDVSMGAMRTKFTELVTKANALNVFPYVKVSSEHIIQFRPHGYTPADHPGIPSATVPIAEAYLNSMVNYANMRTRYTAEQMAEGTVITASVAVAAMFRTGLFECYENQEFYTVFVSPISAAPGTFNVTASFGPKGMPGPTEPAVGTVLDITKWEISPNLMEVGPGLVVAAGLNHYMFNHTTGGSIACGPLLSFLSMFGMIINTMERQASEQVTSLFYEALHPVNKRAVANIFFKRSKVTTHGRATSAIRYEQFKADQFLQIRMQPQPAGAHKAYVCLQGLRKIVAGGLSMFLDWHAQISDVVEMCKTVLLAGAEAHMGAHYYTGRIGISQSASLDAYLPEIACYMNTLARNDTLTMSPHLSSEAAARASLSWQNLMKALKGADYSATDPETVRKFLQSQGKVFHSFDVTKEETWGSAAEVGKAALASIDAAFQ